MNEPGPAFIRADDNPSITLSDHLTPNQLKSGWYGTIKMIGLYESSFQSFRILDNSDDQYVEAPRDTM